MPNKTPLLKPMKGRYLYMCKDNTNQIVIEFVKGEIDQLYLNSIGDNSWLIISKSDLDNAIKQSKRLNKNGRQDI
jgi:hypothetical protein